MSDSSNMIGMMGAGTIALIVVVVLFIILFPVVKILHKAGYSGWWVLLYFVPFGAFIGLWVFAFADWPALQAKSGSSS
jgi:uncharacterized membrane protein YhaH (DUF805 family)